jgi:two-component system, NarL family, sensor kinase
MQDSFKQVIILLVVSTIIIIVFLAFIFTIMFLYKKKQVRLKKDMHILQLDHEKNILNTQLEIQEQTFQQISQEIHDNISLTLTLAKLQLNTYNMNGSADGHNLIESSVDLISKALTDLNDISKSMDSDLIETHGLIHAIEYEVEMLQKTGQLQVEFNVCGRPFFMEASKELVAFRIIQESCNNAIKHSGAKNIFINLYYHEHNIEIQIRDNGSGFDPDELKNRKFNKPFSGIKNIRNRATMLKADINIVSQPGTGTNINLIIPNNEPHPAKTN